MTVRFEIYPNIELDCATRLYTKSIIVLKKKELKTYFEVANRLTRFVVKIFHSRLGHGCLHPDTLQEASGGAVGIGGLHHSDSTRKRRRSGKIDQFCHLTHEQLRNERCNLVPIDQYPPTAT